MKRLLCLAVVLTAIGAACGGDDVESTTSTDATASSGANTTTGASTTTNTAPPPASSTAPPAASSSTTAVVTTTSATPATTTTTQATSTTTASPPAGAALWVTNSEDNKVLKIDPATGDLLAQAAVGAPPAGIALGAGSAWVAINGADYVLRLDATTAAEEGRIVVGGQPAGVAFSDGYAWVSRFEGTVTAIDPATNEIVSVLDVGAGATGMAAGSAWVTTWSDETLVRIGADLTMQTVKIGGAGSSPAVGDGFVGATIYNTGEFDVFTLDGLDLFDSYDTGDNANVATYGFDAFWVTNSNTGDVYKIDPVAGTSQAVTTIPGALGITVGFDMVYVASFSRGVVYQFPPDDPSAMSDLAATGSSAFELAYGAAG